MMMDFNSEIMAVRSFMKERQGLVLKVPGPELPVRYCRNIPPFVVLNEDTAVELGSPIIGSTGMVLCTDDQGLVFEGRITRLVPIFRKWSRSRYPPKAGKIEKIEFVRKEKE